jgi:hypothetical protein
VARFKHPATVLRDRKDLDVVRDVGMERVDTSNSDARFAFLSLFVNRKTAIDTLTSTNELDRAKKRKEKELDAYRRSANEMHAMWRKKKNKHLILSSDREKRKKDNDKPQL